MSKFKAFADIKVNVAQKNWQKGENEGYHHFPLSLQCFENAFFQGRFKQVLCCMLRIKFFYMLGIGIEITLIGGNISKRVENTVGRGNIGCFITSSFYFFHRVFKRLVPQTSKNRGLFGKGLTL